MFQERPNHGADFRAAAVEALERGRHGPRRGTGALIGLWKCSISVTGEAGAVSTCYNSPNWMSDFTVCKLNLHLEHFW